MMSTTLLRLIGATLLSTLLIAAVPVRADDAGARAELIGLWQKMTERRDLAFRVRTTSTLGKGEPMASTMETRWPDRFHMKSDQSEMIILPSGTWMNANGNWMKMPIDMQKMIAQFTPEMMKKSMEGTTNVRFVGIDAVKGEPVKVYTYDFNVEVMGFKSSGNAKIFLRVADGYPLRMESQGKAMGKQTTTVAEYEYDDSIRINAPD